MRAIVTSDLHLSDRPADAYRWTLFPWLREQIVLKKADCLLILGDLTEQKDKHSAVLVNQVVDELRDCATLCRTIVLRGNHDGIDPANPFFAFVDTGTKSQLRFLSKPTLLFTTDRPSLLDRPSPETMLLLPHSRDPAADWQLYDLTADYIFLHQTFEGAEAENGERLPGMSTKDIRPRLLAVSGDIHVPQKIGTVIYCGAPYHIRFGDSFKPRVLLIEGDKTKDLFFPAPRKLTIEVSSIAELKEACKSTKGGDQVHLSLQLKRRDFEDWGKIRQVAIELCRAGDLQVCGAEVHQLQRVRPSDRSPTPTRQRKPADVMRDFAERRQIADAVLAAGLKIVEG